MFPLLFIISTIFGFVLPIQADDTAAVPLYVAYKNYHTLYTKDVNALRSLQSSGYEVNWDYPICYVSPAPQRGLRPLYRLYNSTTGDRIYTIHEDEKNRYVRNLNYLLEAIEGYVLPPIFRSWVPNATTYSIYHQAEYNIRTIVKNYPVNMNNECWGDWEVHRDFAAWTGPCSLNLPQYIEPPANLRAEDTANGITLYWDRVILRYNETIEIQRAPSGGSFQILQRLSNNTNTFTDTSIQDSRTYRYRVMIRGHFADSGYSNEASASHTDSGLVFVQPPAAPSQLNMEENGALLKLTWQDNSPDENGFSIYMKEGENGIYREYAVTGPNTTYKYFADINPNQDKNYFFKVRAFNGPLYSDFTPETFGVIIGRPSNLEATVVSDTRIDLSWVDHSQCEINYSIERRALGEPFTEIKRIGPNVTTFSDNTAAKGVQYFYRVRALEQFGRYSAYSDEVGAMIKILIDIPQGNNITIPLPKTTISLGALSLPPTAPSITDTAVSSVCCCICWDHNSPFEKGFRLERKTEGGSWSVIADNIPANSTLYLDINVMPDTVYYYRLLAFNTFGESDYSDEKIVRTLCGTLGEPPVGQENPGTLIIPDNLPEPQEPQKQLPPRGSQIQQTPQVTGIGTNLVQNLRIQNFITKADGTRAIVLENGKTYPLLKTNHINNTMPAFTPVPSSHIPDLVAKQLNMPPPATVDLRRWQTPFRDQGGRYTCVSFATLAAVEARYKRLDPVKYANIDLSEQYVNHLQKMVSLSKDPSDHPNFRENQHGAWGGSNVYYLAHLFHNRYGIPPESLSPYIPDESYENTNEPGDNPRIDWQSQFVNQRVINDFNLDPDRLSLNTIKEATYGITDYYCFPDDKLNDIHYYESVLAAGYEIIININVMSPDPTPNDTVWNPGTVEEGTHAMLIVGYDDERRVFIVKNSWGYDNPEENGFTLVSYDYITGRHVIEAAYITGVREDIDTPHNPAQLFLGRWKIDHNGQKGILDIFRLPHFYNFFDRGPLDLRIGIYYAQNGFNYKVNGYIKPNEDKLNFYIDFQNSIQAYDDATGNKFTACLFTREPVIMAGEFVDNDGRNYGFYATKENYYSSTPVPGSIRKSSYIGTWQMNHDSVYGKLEIDSVTSGGVVKGTYIALDGENYDVSGTVTGWDRIITLQIPFDPSNPQQFVGYIHTDEPGIITGLTNNKGFIARRIGDISVNAPSNLKAVPHNTTSIALTWQDNSYNETGFVILRKSEDIPYYAEVATTDANSTMFLDIGLASGKTYTYKVKAVKGEISSAYSSEAGSKTKDPVIIDMPKQEPPINIEKPKLTIPKL